PSILADCPTVPIQIADFAPVMISAGFPATFPLSRRKLSTARKTPLSSFTSTYEGSGSPSVIIGRYPGTISSNTNRFSDCARNIPVENIRQKITRDCFMIINDLLLYLRSEEHTSELQSRENLVCRLL